MILYGTEQPNQSSSMVVLVCHWFNQLLHQSAFLASWAHSLNELPIRFPDIKPEIDKVVMSTPSFSCLDQTLNSIVPPSQSLLQMLSESESLQHKLSQENAKMEATCLIQNALSLRDGARLRSLQGKSAGSWSSAIPTSRKLALKPSKFRLAAYLRLGLPCLCVILFRRVTVCDKQLVTQEDCMQNRGWSCVVT